MAKPGEEIFESYYYSVVFTHTHNFIVLQLVGNKQPN